MTGTHSPRAVASLVCAILAFTTCPCIGGILAVILGYGEASELARAGVILGWIHLALCALVAVAAVLLLGVGMAVEYS